ncbi:hypothetical protein BX600DRAFT_152845 [Xylariales sp. PMI_506]|nr:hypothetical protein BX600DRAFT_152845 [Xylariales sp. PMI_506]
MMIQKSHFKVRTGCLTCKVRKVKCDEGKPSCDRCVKTGRKCDGYPLNRHTAALRSQPSRFPGSVHPTNDVRAVEYFCREAAVSLSKPYDPYFWTTLVLQLSSSEPAVRHAVIALSSLYEGFSVQGQAGTELQRNGFALRHYNTAIQHVRAASDESVTMVTCLIFVCLEVIQRNREQAITHSEHGLKLMQTIPATKTSLISTVKPMLRRMRIMPLIYGTLDLLPDLSPEIIIPDYIKSIDEAEGFLEDLYIETFTLVRRMDDYRYGKLVGNPVDSELLLSAVQIRYSLEKLRSACSDLYYDLPARHDGEDARLLVFKLRLEVCIICMIGAHEPDGLVFDQHTDKFKSIVHLVERLIAARRLLAESADQREFRFEVGNLPILCIVATQCRDLATRLKALAVMKHSSGTWECLCERERVYLRCRRVIEIEHQIMLNKQDQPIGQVPWTEFPTKEKRVHCIMSEPYDNLRVKVGGETLIGRPEGFLMRTSSGQMYMRIEFITLSQNDYDGMKNFIQLEKSLFRPYIPLSDRAKRRCEL